MIKLSTFLLPVLLFCSIQNKVFSQTNGSFNYQAVIRMSTGTLVQKTPISVKFSIIDKTDGLVFSEIQNVTTDAYGVINLTIGNGINHTGNLADINWESNQKLKVEVDYDKDGWMDLTGISDITQVPKSFYSSKAGIAEKAEGLTFELAPIAISGDYNDLINKPEEQTLSLDENYQLNISNGNSVDLSVLKYDSPRLSLTGNILSIDRGNDVAIPVAKGDMEKSIYDTNSNNKIDNAETTEKLQGIAVSTTIPVSGQVLQFDGSTWVPGVVAATDEKVKVGTGAAQVLSTQDFDGTNDIVIKAGAITTAKIADASITNEKIASGISASKVGLENVDNTSDANKPVSTATQAALSLKANSADLGTAAIKNVGTGANNVVQLDANSKLPAVDGSQLINLPAAPVTSVAGKSGVITLTKSDVGLENVDNTSDASKPISTATQIALSLKANSADLGTAAIKNVGTGANNVVQLDANSKLPAVDASQLINLPAAPVTSVAGKSGIITLTKSDVGLENVDNTSDASKPVSTATQAALSLKANSADLGTAAIKNVGTGANNVVQLDANSKLPAVDGSQLLNLPSAPVASVSGKTGIVTLTKTDVSLGNVDNTSDANKPVSLATQTALNLKASLASPALTGTPTAPTATPGTNNTQIATTAFVIANSTGAGPLNVTAEQTGNYTALTTDDIILYNASVPSLTLTLPTSGIPIGKKYYISNIGTETVNLSPLPRETGTLAAQPSQATVLMYVGNGEYSLISGF